MNRPLKIALLWLLVVAFPVQGVAATAMLACGPGHHKRMAGGEVHIGVAATGEDHVHYDAGHADVDTSGHTDRAHEGAQPIGKCSACVSCCVGAAIDSEQPRSPNASLSTHIRSLIDRGPAVGFFTDGPERPPRTILA